MVIIQYICVVIAAIILGNWFLIEARKLKKIGKPWYTAYYSTPGILIIAIIIVMPLIAIFL